MIRAFVHTYSVVVNFINYHRMKNNKFKLAVYLLTLCSLAVSCRNKHNEINVVDVQSNKSIEHDSIEIETIVLDSINNSSYGSTSITDAGEIAFVDDNYCLVSLFDTVGNLKSQHLGLGSGPGETSIGHIAAHAFLPKNKLVLFGYNLDFHSFCDYKIDNIFILDRVLKGTAMCDNSEAYTNQYGDMVCRAYNDKLYFNIYSDHPDFNYLDQTKDYLDNCYHIWEIDLKKHCDTRLLAKGYPATYKAAPNKYLIFCGCNFDIDNNGNFYLSYEADSLIYVYNHEFEPIATYGFSGKDLNTDYMSISSFAQCRKNYQNERSTKSYYFWTEYIDQTGLLFRSYKKASADADGLQIYRDGTLIGDVSVPKNFKVIGYVAPYYYSAIIPSLEDEDTSLTIYRFKLGNEKE